LGVLVGEPALHVADADPGPVPGQPGELGGVGGVGDHVRDPAALQPVGQVVAGQQRGRRDDHGAQPDRRQGRLPQLGLVAEHHQDPVAEPDALVVQPVRDLAAALGQLPVGHPGLVALLVADPQGEPVRVLLGRGVEVVLHPVEPLRPRPAEPAPGRRVVLPVLEQEVARLPEGGGGAVRHGEDLRVRRVSGVTVARTRLRCPAAPAACARMRPGPSGPAVIRICRVSELSGDQGVWRFGEHGVRIEYADKWGVHRLLRAVGACTVPFAAVASVDFHAGKGRRKWRLEARLTEGADPVLMSAGAEDDALPFVLTGPASGALLAEYYADQLRAAADGARLAGPAADPGEVARSLVPGLPFKAQTLEGEAVFDGETVRLSWPRLMYSAEKWRQKSRILAAERILRAEWQEPGISGYGGVRFLLREDADVSAALPVYRDPAAPTSMSTKEHVRVRMLAEVANAYLAAGSAAAALEPPGPGGEPAALEPSPPARAGTAGAEAARRDAEEVFRRIRELGRLHEEGLLTAEEFAAKKAELLDRL